MNTLGLGRYVNTLGLGVPYVNVIVVVVTPGGGVVTRTVVTFEDQLKYERLVREDEELVAIIIAAVSQRIIP